MTIEWQALAEAELRGALVQYNVYYQANDFLAEDTGNIDSVKNQSQCVTELCPSLHRLGEEWCCLQLRLSLPPPRRPRLSHQLQHPRQRRDEAGQGPGAAAANLLRYKVGW